MADADADKITFYGYTPVPRDPDVLFKDHPTASGAHPKQDSFEFNDFLPLPNSPLVQKAKAFVKDRLNEQTFNHSHRVYIYGSLSLSPFPSPFSPLPPKAFI